MTYGESFKEFQDKTIIDNYITSSISSLNIK